VVNCQSSENFVSFAEKQAGLYSIRATSTDRTEEVKIMGGSKPPTSKAQKRRAKTLTKLDANRAKRFKLKNRRVQEEHEMWAEKDNLLVSQECIDSDSGCCGVGVDSGNVNLAHAAVPDKRPSGSGSSFKPAIKLVQVPIPVGIKGETKRQRKARLREYVFGD
jgi:hypothetical protein